MRTPIAFIQSLWQPVAAALTQLAPLFDLAARAYLAWVFFISGRSKISDWDTTLFLFREEYRVPLLAPELAAVLATAGELMLPALLLAGLMTRAAALGLWVLNIVAVVSYYAALQNSPAGLQDHLQWGILLALVLAHPADRLTLDHWLARRRGSHP
jgi:putative oxidoreductase